MEFALGRAEIRKMAATFLTAQRIPLLGFRGRHWDAVIVPRPNLVFRNLTREITVVSNFCTGNTGRQCWAKKKKKKLLEQALEQVGFLNRFNSNPKGNYLIEWLNQ